MCVGFGLRPELCFLQPSGERERNLAKKKRQRHEDITAEKSLLSDPKVLK